ncbi:FadD3 family acyl-CoA ligase [Nocardioides ginsengisoli]|uniref:Class I adenylate-forming enzyme family protein n=1 Tax=Nocardioides ginsengisoli TaxID=363868 RepID=A0ABW3W581_9ACTN
MPATLADLWFDRARTQADDLAADDGTRRVSWGELLRLADGAAERLATAGVGAGDVVVLQGRNTVEWVVTAGAVHLLGAALAPLGSEEPAAARQEYAVRVGARAVVAEHPAAGELALSAVQPGDLDAGTLPPRRANPAASAVAVVLATSGTAGHRQWVAMEHAVLIRMYDDVAGLLDMASGDRLLGIVPLAHSFGFNGLLVLALLSGASLRLVPDRDRDALAGLVRESAATIVAGPPALLHDLAAAVRAGESLGPQVRLFMTGATEIRPSALLPLAAEVGIPRVSAGYGLTQTCGTVALCPNIAQASDGAHVPMTVLPGVEVAVLDAVGRPVPPGTRGRVLTRGYHVAVPVGDDGWFVTGDEGHLHPDGSLCVTGRVDDQLVVSGFNVDPVRVELALERSPLVARAAVVGVPDPRSGHRLVAVVVPADGVDAAGRNEAAVLADARAVLTGYEVPRTVVWVDALPHTTTGKLSRAAVRGLLAEHLTDQEHVQEA